MKHYERKSRSLSALKAAAILTGLIFAYFVYARFDTLADDSAAMIAAAGQAAEFRSFLDGAEGPGFAQPSFRAAYYSLGRSIGARRISSPVTEAAMKAAASEYYSLPPYAEKYFQSKDAAARAALLERLRSGARRIHSSCLLAAAENQAQRSVLLAKTAASYFSLFLLLLALEAGGYCLLHRPFFAGLDALRRRVERYASPLMKEPFQGSVSGMAAGVDRMEEALQASMLERMRLARETASSLAGMKAQTRALELTRRKVVTLVEDLDEARRQLQKEQVALKAAGERLARSNRDLEQFAYVASHDLKEPLRVVSSFSGLLAKRYSGKLDKDADDFIRFITEGAQRATDLISALLNYSRVTYSPRDFRPVDCLDALQKALFNLKIALEERGASVTWDRLPQVMGDEAQLVQLFQNLLSNALKFNAAQRPEIRVGCRETPSSWILAFSDNGIGIAPEHFERIFLIFQRLHPQERYPGAGIGLALCKKIAQNHGGGMTVESAPGRGSTFSVELPRMTAAPAAAEAAKRKANEEDPH